MFEGLGHECRFLLDDVGPLQPGSGYTIPVVFLVPEVALGRLRPGTRFEIYEGRIVGSGEILEARSL